MSATIDSLEIQIDAQATKANSALDKLASKLEALSSSLGKLNVGNLTSLASGVSSLSTAMQGMQNVKKTDFNRVAKGLEAISSVNTENLTSIANSLNPLAASLQTLGNVNFDNRNLNNVINSITRLANANVGNLQGLDQLGSSLRGLIDNIAGAGNVERTTTSLVNGIARLANAGSKTMLAANALPVLSKELKKFINTIAFTTKNVPAETSALVNAIAKLASAGSKTAVTAANLEELSNKLILFMKSLEDAPRVSENTIRLVTAISNLASAGSNANRAFGNIANFGKRGFSAINSLSNTFKNLIPNMKNATKSSKGFASQLGILYAKVFAAVTLFKKLGNAITSATDYIEEFNYFNVAMGKIADENKKQFAQYGYDDAESYANSFKTRLTELASKMSGFNIDINGELSNSGMKNLGLNVSEIMNFESRVAQITNSVGMLGEASVASSKALTMLSGDLSSLANVDLDQVMDNLSSGMTGMTAAVKKYGMDISVASLKQYALGLGIEKNISSMTQAEKMYLRVIAMLDQSKVAWGDLANTINQPANQFRMLKNNIKATGMMLGKIFLPIIEAVLPYLNAMTLAVKDLVQWIGDLFGIKWNNSSIAAPDDSGWTDLGDDVDDVSSAIDNAADAQKKFNKQLQGFDELNNLSSASDSNGKDNAGNGNSDASGILSNALINAVEDYEKRWNKAFNSMTSKADELKQKIEEVFKKDWDVADFTDVGAALGTWIKNGLDNIPWETLNEGFQKVGKSIGTFINGFVSVEGLGDTIGSSIANAIDAGVKGLNAFFTTVEWGKVGEFIASGVNGAITTDLFKDIGSLLGNKLNAALQTLDGFSEKLQWGKMGETIIGSMNSFLDTFQVEEAGLSFGKFVSGIATALYTVVSSTETWSKLGTKMGDGINGFFEGMNIKSEDTGLTGWQELGKSISDTISGMATSITTALKTADWIEVGNAIGDFIASIEWGKVVWNLTKMADGLFTAIVDAVAGFAEKAPLETAVVGLFAGLTLTGVTGNIAKALTAALGAKGLTLGKCAIGLSLAAATFKFMQSDSELGNLVGAPLTAFLAAYTFTGKISVGLKIAAVTFAWDAGMDIGKKLGEALFGVDSDWSWFDYSLEEWKDAFCEALKDGLGAWGELFGIAADLAAEWKDELLAKMKSKLFNLKLDMKEIGEDLWNGIFEGLSNIGNSIKKFGEKIVKAVKDFFGIHSPSTVFKELGGYLVDGLIEGIKSIGDKVKETLKTAWNKVTTWWDEKVKLPDIKVPSIGSIKEKISNAWTTAKEWWNEKVKLPSIKAPDIGDIKKAISSAWTTAKDWWKDNVKLPNISAPSIGDIKSKLSSAWSKAKEWWTSKVKLPSIKFPAISQKTVKNWLKPIVTVANTLIGKINNLLKISWKDFKVAGKTIISGGSFTIAQIPTIKGYAIGGFPQKADLFYANENGKPEMIGRMGSRTAVANNDQIVTAVSDGVFNALEPVLTSVVNAINGMNTGGTPLYVEGVSEGDIVKITTDANKSHKKRYGTPLYT